MSDLRRGLSRYCCRWPGKQGAGQLQEIAGLKEQEFQNFIVKLSVAFAEALEPENYVKALSRWSGLSFRPQESIVAAALAESVMDIDILFDKGNEKAFSRLKSAHSSLRSAVESVRVMIPGEPKRAGVVDVGDSRLEKGIRAADIAAGYASRIFERRRGNTYEGARAVAEHFDVVFLNDRRIRPEQ